MSFLGIGKRKKSGRIAKERIAFVLYSDRLALSPKKIEELKKDFYSLVLKYVKLNEEDISIKIRREGKRTILIAEFPMKQN